MNRQKDMARKALREKVGSAWGQGSLPEGIDRTVPTVFTGYETLADEGVIKAILVTDEASEMLSLSDLAVENQKVTLITDRTPFYGAAGGQTVMSARFPDPLAPHACSIRQKPPRASTFTVPSSKQAAWHWEKAVALTVDRTSRLSTARNHTTTHILHKALRQVLGDLLLRLDRLSRRIACASISPFPPMTAAEKAQVEQIVNGVILENFAVQTDVMSLDEARQSGAMALFDEKYGDRSVLSASVISARNCAAELT
jgi:alanyl-tRNA synthetase